MTSIRYIMSEFRFTDGNLIILYGINRGKSVDGELPDHIKERVKVCLGTFNIIMKSKPDKQKTLVIVVAEEKSGKLIKEELVKEGVEEKIIAIDSSSENVAQTFDRIIDMIKTRSNPPYIYFIGSVWLRDIYDSTVVSKLKGYKVRFEGALDHRPVEEVEKEKALDVPRKSIEHYKKRSKDKAIDMLLNYIFPDKR
jgi:hypothetical protein